MRLWLIDGSYLYTAQRSIDDRYQFDYLKLRRKLEETGTIWRAYYLNAARNPSATSQDPFHTWLRSAPPRGPQIITKIYPLRPLRADRAYCEQCQAQVSVACPNSPDHSLGNEEQKGVDVGIATLALVHRDRYETLLLSSGDADLVDAIEFLSEVGKRIELAVFHEGVSTELQARADRVHWIDDFADEVRRDDMRR
ncbi:MAG: hypothetical protein KatS3mg076_1865 [Candidatus Binatia bacterium]|nr:MAG: hypothetical protein KatS3mg076_1865 [Candidatus Binatia bacterium]